MNKFIIAGIIGVVLTSQAVAQNTVIVSCYRGPWKDVIWDRANPKFIDSLVAVGFSYGTASGIGERICRDPNLVGHPDLLRREINRILQTVARDG